MTLFRSNQASFTISSFRVGIVFFVAVPLLLAALMLITGNYLERLGAVRAALYVGALSLFPWWLAGASTWGIQHILRAYSPPLWILTAIGASVASLFVVPYLHVMSWLFLPEALPWPFTMERVQGLMLSMGRAVVLWTAFNYVFAATYGWTWLTDKSEPAVEEPQLAVARFENSGTEWTSEGDEQLTMLVYANLNTKEIAARMSRTVGSIRGRRAKLRLPTERQLRLRQD